MSIPLQRVAPKLLHLHQQLVADPVHARREQAVEGRSICRNQLLHGLEEIRTLVSEPLVEVDREIRPKELVDPAPILRQLFHRRRSPPISPPRLVMVLRKRQDRRI